MKRTILILTALFGSLTMSAQITSISNGETGASVRSKLNEMIDSLNRINNLMDLSNSGYLLYRGDSLDMGSIKITNLGTPTNANDATSKTYVDGLVTGSGGGNVSTSGLTNNQVAIASGANTIDGGTGFTYDGTTVTIGDTLDVGVILKSDSLYASGDSRFLGNVVIGDEDGDQLQWLYPLHVSVSSDFKGIQVGPEDEGDNSDHPSFFSASADIDSDLNSQFRFAHLEATLSANNTGGSLVGTVNTWKFDGTSSYTEGQVTGHISQLEGDNPNITITDYHGFKANKPDDIGGTSNFAGTITNYYGFFAEANSQATNTWAFYSEGNTPSFISSILLEDGDITAGESETGDIIVQIDNQTISDGEQRAFQAFATHNSNTTLASLGARTHAGITNGVAVLLLEAEDGAQNFLWVDNTDDLRISTSSSHTGTTSGTAVGDQSSDIRLKSTMPFTYGLKEIIQINPIKFKYNDDVTEENRIGLSAQQVKPIIKEVVYDTGEEIEGYEGEETKLAMRYADLVPVLIQAIKELEARVKELEKKDK